MRSAFELITTDKSELAVLSLKSKIAMMITSIIREKNLTQSQVAQLSGVPRSRVSHIMTGSLSKMSTDYMVKIASKLGCNVDTSICKSDSAIKTVEVRVSYE